MTEREMLENYSIARADKEKLDEALKEATLKLDRCETILVDALIDKGAKSTANYDGIGRYTLLGPAIKAYYDEGSQEEVFSFVAKEKHEAIIKKKIHHTAFSTFIKAVMFAGRNPPDSIGYYFEEKGRFNKPKKTQGEDDDATIPNNQ